MKLPNETGVTETLEISIPKLGVVTFLLTAILVSAICWSGILNKASTPVALVTAHDLRNAIASFHEEYGRYPGFDAKFDTDLQSDHDLMDVLLAAEYTTRSAYGNPYGVAFFTGSQAKPIADGGYRKGIQLKSGGRGELWDPWGKYYRVRIDTNQDSRVADPSGKTNAIEESILVWSAGPDGDFDTWQDNVKTW